MNLGHRWRTVRREIGIAAATAGAITAVILARRWTSALLGHGIIDETLLAESAVVADLMATIDARLRARRRTSSRSRGETR